MILNFNENKNTGALLPDIIMFNNNILLIHFSIKSRPRKVNALYRANKNVMRIHKHNVFSAECDAYIGTEIMTSSEPIKDDVIWQHV